ncbi:MAG: gamma-glutamyl-phosphate reductase, partial [Ruminococcaceae bacterium]|nr:gamma-glutamyl-phosphate reductase [Oscillospiraceae bacterium]
MLDLNTMGARAKAASRVLATASTSLKNSALEAMAAALIANSEDILRANAVDMENGIANGMTVSLQDRLRLTPERIRGMADGVLETAALTDPCGEIISGAVGTKGLAIRKIRVPMGVIGIICEARPNVTSDAAALCLKSGNACILRSGKEAINSNIAIMSALRGAVESVGLPADCVQ